MNMNMVYKSMAYKSFLYLLLIALYIYVFGLASFNRYKEESIVTINKILPISSREIIRKPGIIGSTINFRSGLKNKC